MILAWAALAQAEPRPLMVGAAASLHEALVEATREFDQPVRFQFAATSVVARQIESGAPIDLFLSADEANMDELEESGKILKGTRHDLLANELVLIVPRGASAIKGISDLAGEKVRAIAVCDAAVPVGGYARTILERHKLLTPLAKKIVKPADVRGAVSMVAARAVDAGFVYATDAALHQDKVRVVAVFEDVPVRYPVAIVKGTADQKGAQSLIDFLRTDPKAERAFARFGFKRLK